MGQSILKLTKIRDKDNDGVIEMFNNVNPYNDLDNYLEWKIIGNKLIRSIFIFISSCI